MIRSRRITPTAFLATSVLVVTLCSYLFGAAASADVRSNMTTTTAIASPRELQYPSRVAVFGDSLAWEAEPYYLALMRAEVGPSAITYDSFGGTAICDWLPTMRRVENSDHPQAVELEFSGDALTPCMKGLARPERPYYEKYRADTEAAINIFIAAGAHVYLIGAPITRVVESAGGNWNALNVQYAQIAATTPRHVTYVDAGTSVEGPGHAYTQTLPCLPIEPCTGPVVDAARSNTVRAPDGVHFCPVARGNKRGVIRRCAVYSSGAFRYASAMVEPLATATYLPRNDRVPPVKVSAPVSWLRDYTSSLAS